MSTSPDLCIIGAGALGIDLALYARRLGASVVLADRDRIEPGDAVRHALRMASLVESAKRAQDMRRAPELGVGGSDSKLSVKQIAERASRLVDSRSRATSNEVLTAQGITVTRGAVRFVDSRSLLIGDVTIKPAKIIVALGGTPVVPTVPGLADVAFFDLDSILENQRKLTHLVIMGGDAASVEQAQLQRRLGAQVTLVPQGALLPGIDPEATALLMNALASEGINIRAGAKVVAFQKRSQGIGVEIETAEGGRESLDASHVLVSAGRAVALDEIDIAKVNLKVDGATQSMLRGPLGETSLRSIRLVGAAAGQESWSEARAHGRAVVDSFIGGGQALSAIRIPRIVETEPALAQIGPLLEPKGRPRPGDTIIRENMAENDRAAAMGSAPGLVKVLVNGQGQIQRASLIGPHAVELAGALALVMGRKAGLAELDDLPVPRPSVFEILCRLGENYLGSRTVSPKGKGGLALLRLLRR